MPDIRDRVEQDRGLLKKIQLAIPGYAGYRRREDIRAADNLLRIQLDAEEIVRRADVLSPPVASIAGDRQLDLLEQSSVLFDSIADVGHVRFLRAFHLMICLDMYLGV